jgi:hypothetical protein
MRRLLSLAAVLAAAAATTATAGHGTATRASCTQPRVTSSYAARVMRALRAKQDVWGNELIAWRNGPTYAGARRYLKPLLFAQSRGKPLTASGVYYLPFAQPLGVRGGGSIALHVADGSQILSQKVKGRSLTIYVGANGRERYGSCLTRLTPARLAGGYLPILQTQYRDARGVRYRQESFAVRGLGTGSLVSFVRLRVDTPAGRSATVRLTPSTRRLRLVGEDRLGKDATHLVFSEGGRFDGSSVRYTVPAGTTATMYAGWLVQAGWGVRIGLDDAAYEEARQRLTQFWMDRLDDGAALVVPERKVMDAQRSVLTQNLALTWRYSIGNTYQQFSFAEALDVGDVMGSYGFSDVTRAILRASLGRVAVARSNWRKGESLVTTAHYYRLTGDRDYLDASARRLARFVRSLGRQVWRRGSRSVLRREGYSSDISTLVYGLHSQTVVWQGLRAMSTVWAETGRRALARDAARLAARLGEGLREAVRESSRRLPDGSLFVPTALRAGHKPFDALTASRPGSYWNLVMPYALASGFFTPHGRQARGVLDYMSKHGSRLLGLVRAGAYSLYRLPKYPRSGIDQVYGLNVARFLADNDRPDQLVLSLYGTLAGAMTPDTFVSGEAASVAPVRGALYRSMYLPPNGASNAAFLETLRLMLVHETRNLSGGPAGLELAYATPRPWLGKGKTIEVRDAPTSFGPVSFRLSRSARTVEGWVDVPSRRHARALRLRLRLPNGTRITSVQVDGRPHRRYNARTGTIDLTGRRGIVELLVAVSPS